MLNEEINKLNEKTAKLMPNFIKKMMTKATERLAESDLEKNALTEGDVFPDFDLPNALNKHVSLKKLLKDGPIIINFYRGAWCPYCNLELKAYQDMLPTIKKRGVTFVAISPELPNEALSIEEKLSLQYQVLSDENNILGKKLGIVYTLEKKLRFLYRMFGMKIASAQGNKKYELPIPATYVISKEGKIIYAYINSDYTKRPEPTDVLKHLP